MGTLHRAAKECFPGDHFHPKQSGEFHPKRHSAAKAKMIKMKALLAAKGILPEQPLNKVNLNHNDVLHMKKNQNETKLKLSHPLEQGNGLF